jgi:hypothetical protein
MLHDVLDTKHKLAAAAGSTSLVGQRIGFLVENSYDYVGMDTPSVGRY